MGFVVVHASSRLLHVRVATDAMDIVHGADLIIYTLGVVWSVVCMVWAWCGIVWCGVVWCGVVWCGLSGGVRPSCGVHVPPLSEEEEEEGGPIHFWSTLIIHYSLFIIHY